MKTTAFKHSKRPNLFFAEHRLISEHGPRIWLRRRWSSHQKAIQCQPPRDFRFCRLPR